MEFPEEASQPDEVNNVNSDMPAPEDTEFKTTHETESSEDANSSTTRPVSTEFFAPDFDTIWEQSDDLSDNLSNDLPDDVPNTNDLPDDLPDASSYSYDDRSSNGFFGDINNGEFAWRRTDSTFIQNLYRLIELRSDTSTTGTVDKAIIHPPDLGNLCNTLAPESYHSIADIRFEKLGKEHLDLVGCYGNRELILKLLLQSNCINQDRLIAYINIDKYQYCIFYIYAFLMSIM
ncbi:4746_t:CDS:2 [Paraglomus brasilianum]|uniref:4746_t:CDS:1 n=1 Tax=Paraglomus brasilianum TaxID=144538 RepID=A0A9N9GJC3_9GLOM|nr:4746_t:CDS:2 [Paraglomus brasilianum]